MADTISKERRSALMKRVRQRDTAPELIVRKGLHHRGIRFLLNDHRLPGSPDLVMPKWRAVVFVHGCFWHGHGCKKSRLPSSNKLFWSAKVAANKERDQRKSRALRSMGWRVFTIWDCQLQRPALARKVLDRVVQKIRDE